MRRCLFALGLLLSLAGLSAAAPPQRAVLRAIEKRTAEPLTVEQMYAALDEHFQKLGVAPHDLISQSQAKAALDALKKLGFKPKQPETIVARFLPDDDWLVKTLSDRAGRSFARRAAKYPDSYDRLDRLRNLPRGQQTIRDLIRAKDGEKMIEYMTTTKGGAVLGEQLSSAPKGDHFNALTDRLYTPSDLGRTLERRLFGT